MRELLLHIAILVNTQNRVCRSVLKYGDYSFIVKTFFLKRVIIFMIMNSTIVNTHSKKAIARSSQPCDLLDTAENSFRETEAIG